MRITQNACYKFRCLSSSNHIKWDSQREEHWAVYYKQVSGDFPGGKVDRNPPVNAGDRVSIPGLGRSYMLWSNKACVLQLLSHEPRACAGNKRSHHSEKPVHADEEEPLLIATREKPAWNSEDPVQPKINKWKNKQVSGTSPWPRERPGAALLKGKNRAWGGGSVLRHGGYCQHCRQLNMRAGPFWKPHPCGITQWVLCVNIYLFEIF